MMSELAEVAREIKEEEKSGLDTFVVRRIPHGLFMKFVRLVVEPLSKGEVTTSDVSSVIIELMQKAVNEEKQ